MRHIYARLPDLNPLDFYFWGALKAIVYGSGRALRTAHDLRDCIEEAVVTLARNRATLRRMRDNLVERLQACIDNDGGHVEVGRQAQLLRAIGTDGFSSVCS